MKISIRISSILALLGIKTINPKWVRIIRCEKDNYWYKNMVGLKYMVCENPEFGVRNEFKYILYPSPPYLYFIAGDDCEDLYS